MTTAAYPIIEMHPWFRMPTLKRKSTSTDSTNSSASDLSDLEALPHAHTHKRRKCEVLETGIAQLSLQTSCPPFQQAPLAGPSTQWVGDASFVGSVPQPSPLSGWSSSPSPISPPHAYSVEFPGSVEEPTSPAMGNEPEIPEVKMKGTSWYEPEKDRIVITDLDDDSDADDAETSGGLSVNSALMSRLKANLNASPIPREPENSRALVLFRPLTVPDITESQDKQQQQQQQQKDYDTINEVIIEDDYIGSSSAADDDDDDAMDIEYL